MNKKQSDRHLDVPAEANRDKHINFVAVERNEVDPAKEPSTGPLAKGSVDQRFKENKRKRKN